jgi:hypothetical protein
MEAGMTDAERIRDLEIENRQLELDKARLSGEVNGLRAVLEVMRHLLPSAAPGVAPVVVPLPWEGSCYPHPAAGCAAGPMVLGEVAVVTTKGWKGNGAS